MRPNKRIGLIVPAGNTTFEPDFHAHFALKATVHATRIAGPKGVESEKGIDAFNEQIVRASQELARAKVDVIAYGFTTGSFYRGIEYSASLIERISQIAGVPAVTPSNAIMHALRVLRAKRIFIATPYPVWNNQVLLDYLKQTDLQIVGLQGDDREPEEAILQPMWNQTPDQIVNTIAELHIPPVNALLCPCTAWRTVEVIPELEQQVGRPVVTANQATMWETALLLGEPFSAHDRLGMLCAARVDQ